MKASKNLCIGLAALTMLACNEAQAPDAKTASAVARDVPSNGEIPAENLRGTSGGGDYDQGVAALGNGDLESARATYTRMHERDPRDGTAFVLLGLVDEKSGDRNGAETAYTDSIRLHAGLETPYINLTALLMDDDRMNDARVVARAGLARFPSNAAIHANMGALLAREGDQTDASEQFDEATQASPPDPQLLVTYGHWLGVWKREDAAVAKLRAARALTKDRRMLLTIGQEMKAVGAFADCVPTFDRAIAIKDDPELRTHRAVCKMGAKDTDGAKADLQAAIVAEYAPAHFYLARLFADANDWKGAVEEYQAFLKLEPNVPAAKTAREKLRLAAAHVKK